MVNFIRLMVVCFVAAVLVGCGKEPAAPAATPPAVATVSFMAMPTYVEGTSEEFEAKFGADAECTSQFIKTFQFTRKLSPAGRQLVATEVTPRLKQVAWEIYTSTGEIGTPQWMREYMSRVSLFADSMALMLQDAATEPKTDYLSV